MFTTPFQLTKSMHRDVYAAVDPKSPDLAVSGKVVLVTGAGGGLGYVRTQWIEFLRSNTDFSYTGNR